MVSAKKTAKKAAIIPKSKSLEEQVRDAMKIPSVKKFFSKISTENYERYKKLLEECIREANYETASLKKFAKFVDTTDRLLVPARLFSDYLGFIALAGYPLYFLKETIESPIKLIYLAYYLTKTGDLGGTLGSALYELATMVPGLGFLDLTNWYIRKAEKYATKTGAKKFLEKVYQTKEIKKEKKKEKGIERILASVPT